MFMVTVPETLLNKDVLCLFVYLGPIQKSTCWPCCALAVLMMIVAWILLYIDLLCLFVYLGPV